MKAQHSLMECTSPTAFHILLRNERFVAIMDKPLNQCYAAFHVNDSQLQPPLFQLNIQKIHRNCIIFVLPNLYLLWQPS